MSVDEELKLSRGESEGWITIMYEGVTLHACGRLCAEKLYPKPADKVEEYAKKRKACL
jgi:hypothetical protein